MRGRLEHSDDLTKSEMRTVSQLCVTNRPCQITDTAQTTRVHTWSCSEISSCSFFATDTPSFQNIKIKHLKLQKLLLQIISLPEERHRGFYQKTGFVCRTFNIFRWRQSLHKEQQAFGVRRNSPSPQHRPCSLPNDAKLKTLCSQSFQLLLLRFSSFQKGIWDHSMKERTVPAPAGPVEIEQEREKLFVTRRI